MRWNALEWWRGEWAYGGGGHIASYARAATVRGGVQSFFRARVPKAWRAGTWFLQPHSAPGVSRGLLKGD